MQQNVVLSARPPTVPPSQILQSQLMRQGGYAVLPGPMDTNGLTALQNEALKQQQHAQVCESSNNLALETRGGSPARRLLSAPGGPTQDAFYHAPWMLTLLGNLVGLPVRTTGERGTFTYYARAGDHLDLHRDIESCDLAFITCLHENGGAQRGGQLCLYPDRWRETLNAVRSTPQLGQTTVSLEVGQSAVLLGGVVPHFVAPVHAGQVRIVSVLCYEIVL